MIMRKRAELDTVNPPGQIVNRPEYTLHDYLDRKYPKENKLTFDDWWKINGIGGQGLYEIAKEAWKAAQENK